MVPEAIQPNSELKMAAAFENMGYEAIPKTVSRLKWSPNLIKGSLKLKDLSLS